MDLTFFTDPRFLALIRFWRARQNNAGPPQGEAELVAALPPEIAPHMIVARFDGSDGVYRYVGPGCVSRFGTDPTGQRVTEFLTGAVRDYVLDMARTAQSEGAPVFSFCLYRIPEEEPIRTARIFAPFAPDIVVTLQLYEESETPLTRYARRGRFEEIVRKRIRTDSDALDKLAQAARLHRLGRTLHITSIADDLMAAARAFDAEATEPLPVLRTKEGGEENAA